MSRSSLIYFLIDCQGYDPEYLENLDTVELACLVDSFKGLEIYNA